MDRWTEYEFFVRVVEMGSLTKAAASLGISNPAASRHLASLEKRLGARLVERSTRSLFVTEIGHEFVSQCKFALEHMQEAVDAVTATNSNPTGLLRVTASLSLMLRHIAPLLSEFSRRCPNVRVELLAANRYYDIIDNNIDVAIRTREHEPDTSLVVRPLTTTRRLLAAAPRYIEQYGIPEDPRALSEHRLLGYTYHSPGELTFCRADESLTIKTVPLFAANDGQILRSAAIDGLGILAQPMYVIHDDLVAGRLIPLLLDWELPRMSINIVYPRRKLVPPKTRAFIDFLVQHFAAHDYERRWDALLEAFAKAR